MAKVLLMTREGMPSVSEKNVVLAFRVSSQYLSRTSGRRIFLAFGVRDLDKLFRMGSQFAVISGYRAELGKHENQGRHGNLVGDIQRMGYRRMVPMKSSWEDMATGVRHSEKSVMVPGMEFQDAVKLMNDYKQDAILYKDRSGTIGVYFNNGTATMAFNATDADLAVLESTDPTEYSKGRDFSFGLQLVEDKKFRWSGGPVTKREVLEQLAA